MERGSNKRDLIKKIISKKEFSLLPLEDVGLVFENFDKDLYSDEEKVKFSRNLLRKMYTVFLSNKLLKYREKNEEWFLNKHLSTKERMPFYKEVYEKIFSGFKGKTNVYDMGSGVNSFSHYFFPKKLDLNYFGIEAVGQLVEVQKKFFLGKKNFHFFHESLFDLERIKEILKKGNGKKVVFLFKAIDSLEMLKKNYSKTLLEEIVPLVDLVVVSFATKSLGSKKRFFVDRKWIKNFIEKNFELKSSFEEGNEEYILFSKKDL